MNELTAECVERYRSGLEGTEHDRDASLEGRFILALPESSLHVVVGYQVKPQVSFVDRFKSEPIELAVNEALVVPNNTV